MKMEIHSSFGVLDCALCELQAIEKSIPEDQILCESDCTEGSLIEDLDIENNESA